MRQAPPNCLFYFLKLLRRKHSKEVNENGTFSVPATGGERSSNNCNMATTIEMQALIEVLINVGKYPTEIAEQIVLDAVEDGLLVPASKISSNDEQLVRFPVNREIKQLKKDLYCYECHLPGFLEHCRQCHRSFHIECYRRNPLKPNYAVPSSKDQKNPLPEFSSDSEISDEVTNCYERSPDDSGRGQSLSVLNLIQTTNNSSLLSPVTAQSPLEPPLSTNNFSSFKTDDNDFGVEFDNTGSSLFSWENLNTLNEGKPILSETISKENHSYTAEISPRKKYAELDSKTRITDVVYLGLIRPPNRKRRVSRGAVTVTTNELTDNDGTFVNSSLNLSYNPPLNFSLKNESSSIRRDESNEEWRLELKLCTCCRLMRTSDIQQPPNLDADELCYLIGYTFKRNRSWLKHDLVSYLKNMKMTPDTIKTISDLLFVRPIKCLTDIEQKIQSKNYNLLIEFLIDLLDIQHEIGVFFGDNSLELDATKWLLRDVTHDLSEIRRCPDCFRHSSEKNSCRLWFAKPCFQRHELVFAKQSGFSYWPAKVIRVLNRNNNTKYDVRFFGGNHSRALVDARHIRTIDTDIKQLNIGNRRAIKKALEELYYHQLLGKYSPSEFGYKADPQKAKSIIEMVTGGNIMAIGEEENRPNSTETRLLMTSANLQPLKENYKRRSSRQKEQTFQRQLEMRNQFQQSNQSSTISNYNNNLNRIRHSNDFNIIRNQNEQLKNFHSVETGEQQPTDNAKNPTCSVAKKNKSKIKTKKNSYALRDRSQKKNKSTTYPQLRVNVKRLNVDKQNVVQANNNHGRNNIEEERMCILEKLKVVQKELEETRTSLNDLTSRNTYLENQLNGMKKLAKQQNRNIKSIKRKRWCAWCLEKATYSCCFEASYCSDECQKHDWIKGHSKICRILRKFANYRRKLKK